MFNLSVCMAFEWSRFDIIDVTEPVTKLNPTTPKTIMKMQNIISNEVCPCISPYPTVVIVVIVQYMLVVYIYVSV